MTADDVEAWADSEVLDRWFAGIPAGWRIDVARRSIDQAWNDAIPTHAAVLANLPEDIRPDFQVREPVWLTPAEAAAAVASGELVEVKRWGEHQGIYLPVRGLP